MSMTSKYVYANIRIPLEIRKDQSYELLNDYMEIEFEPCSQLPIQKMNTNSSVLSQLFSVFTQPKDPVPVLEDPDPVLEDPVPVLEDPVHENKMPKVNPLPKTSNSNIMEEIMKVVTKDFEKRTPKKRQNTTFRHHRHIGSHYTRKSYTQPPN
jgi:hypothetical protein